jgi:hypothetical protein
VAQNAGESNRCYAVHGKNTKMSSYYNAENPTAFSTWDKLSAALPKKQVWCQSMATISRRLYDA